MAYLMKIATSVSADYTNQIMDKTLWYKLLELPPVDLSTFEEMPIFFKDPDMSYQKYMTYGKDFSVPKNIFLTLSFLSQK